MAHRPMESGEKFLLKQEICCKFAVIIAYDFIERYEDVWANE